MVEPVRMTASQMKRALVAPDPSVPATEAPPGASAADDAAEVVVEIPDCDAAVNFDDDLEMFEILETMGPAKLLVELLSNPPEFSMRWLLFQLLKDEQRRLQILTYWSDHVLYPYGDMTSILCTLFSNLFIKNMHVTFDENVAMLFDAQSLGIPLDHLTSRELMCILALCEYDPQVFAINANQMNDNVHLWKCSLDSQLSNWIDTYQLARCFIEILLWNIDSEVLFYSCKHSIDTALLRTIREVRKPVIDCGPLAPAPPTCGGRDTKDRVSVNIMCLFLWLQKVTFPAPPPTGYRPPPADADSDQPKTTPEAAAQHQ
jgi:hypothetical protein